MKTPWLTGLLRARQVQEDSAKQRLATAERLARTAHARVRYDADRLDSLREAQAEESVPAFVAAAVALQAAAATHAAASRAADQATQGVAASSAELLDAAVARRTAEELYEREVASERARAHAAAQREQDEIAARIHRDTAVRRA
jgi:hypothetical protein